MDTDIVKRFAALFGTLDLDEVLANPDDHFDQASRCSVSGHIIGYHLDNAMGDHIALDAVVKGYQEYVLSIEVFDGYVKEGTKFRRGLFNMASLIAALRAKSDILSQESMFRPIMWFIDRVTQGCRNDMHEPDEQGLTMDLSNDTQFVFGTFPFNDTMVFNLKRETPADPTMPITQANFSIETLIRMLMYIRA